MSDPPSAGTTADPPRRRRLVRAGLFLLSAGSVVAAALLVPMPQVEVAPGAVTPISALVAVDAETTPLTGQIGLLTVRINQPSIVELVRAWMDDERNVRSRDAVIPAALNHRTYIELQQQEFRRSFRVAVAVGLQAAGLDVDIRTAPQVAEVLPGGPADGRLQIGDVIRSFNGQAVVSVEEVVAQARRAAIGDVLAIDVERQGTPVHVTVVAGRVPGLEHPGMGISLQTLEEDIGLPFDVSLTDQQGIGGPSAGLMIALTVYDLVSEEDLLGGLDVVGTGTVGGDGAVGRIGSVREKTLTAIAAGADLMLVPSSQVADARAVGQDRIRIVGVASFEEALAALRG